jgi:hypothetical protein
MVGFNGMRWALAMISAQNASKSGGLTVVVGWCSAGFRI